MLLTLAGMAGIEPFRIEASEAVLKDLQERLERTRLPDEAGFPLARCTVTRTLTAAPVAAAARMPSQTFSDASNPRMAA